MILRSGILGSHSKYTFNIIRDCQTVLKTVCTILHFHKQCIRVAAALHPHQHLVLSGVVVLPSTTNRFVVITYHSFNLPFLNDQWNWASFHVLICLLLLFFHQVAVQMFCSFFSCVVSLLGFKSSLNLDTTLLSDMCFVNILPKSAACLFILLMMSSKEQNLFNFEKVHLSIFSFTD